ncbi:unnamed protein product [marine sediment metagenome]|uniref:Uncharacterized protein n=1 Tax=marine sediment metagenome TaxID=412755 RepID=X1QHG7_9ZZZZ
MKIRDTCLDYQHAFIQNALTWTFPINIVDPVTEFKIHFRAQCNASAGEADGWYYPPPVPYLIEEIAVIDGSEVIYALNGAEAWAMSGFDLGYLPMHRHHEFPGATSHWCFPIHFGRDLTDPEWIFDPKKFRNPQIRITWDLAAVVPIGPGGMKSAVDEAIEISIWAKIMEEGARPRGYLMTKQVKEYTPAGPGDEVTWLPVDFPIRKLMVRSYEENGIMGENTNHLKLSQDQDKWIPFDLAADDFIRLMINWFPEMETAGDSCMSDLEYREHFGGWLGHGLICSGTHEVIAALRDWTTNMFRAGLADDDGTETPQDARVEVYFIGLTRTPMDCFCYPFGDQENAADWLQTGPMGNLRLILTHQEVPLAHEYPLVQIVTQQAHPY